MKDNRRFRKGSGVYKCISCGRQTRETGQDESRNNLCLPCYEVGGLENAYFDGGLTWEQFEAEVAPFVAAGGRVSITEES